MDSTGFGLVALGTLILPLIISGYTLAKIVLIGYMKKSLSSSASLGLPYINAHCFVVPIVDMVLLTEQVCNVAFALAQ